MSLKDINRIKMCFSCDMIASTNYIYVILAGDGFHRAKVLFQWVDCSLVLGISSARVNKHSQEYFKMFRMIIKHVMISISTTTNSCSILKSQTLKLGLFKLTTRAYTGRDLCHGLLMQSLLNSNFSSSKLISVSEYLYIIDQ